MRSKSLMSWSSGKDGAWALHKLQHDSDVEIAGLFCTVNKEFDRIAMHGVRLENPYPCSNAECEPIFPCGDCPQIRFLEK